MFCGVSSCLCCRLAKTITTTITIASKSRITKPDRVAMAAILMAPVSALSVVSRSIFVAVSGALVVDAAVSAVSVVAGAVSAASVAACVGGALVVAAAVSDVSVVAPAVISVVASVVVVLVQLTRAICIK